MCYYCKYCNNEKEYMDMSNIEEQMCKLCWSDIENDYNALRYSLRVKK